MQEIELRKQISGVVEIANTVLVCDDETFLSASKDLIDLKSVSKRVVDFFSEIKSNAYNSWKAICDKEKEYSKPITEATNIIKKKISDYQMELEKIRQKEILELERIKKEKAEKLEREAKELEAFGFEEEAKEVSTKAENVLMSEINKPIETKAKGISFRVDYDLEIIDETLVPINIGHTVIRPVDLSIVKSLVKQGYDNIPGIKITEKKTVVTR